jgi:excisionase family DNA binding protein
MDKYLTVKEAGEILNIGKTKMYELVNQPDFPSVKMGKKILIPESELDKFMRRYL